MGGWAGGTPKILIKKMEQLIRKEKKLLETESESEEEGEVEKEKPLSPMKRPKPEKTETMASTRERRSSESRIRKDPFYARSGSSDVSRATSISRSDDSSSTAKTRSVMTSVMVSKHDPKGKLRQASMQDFFNRNSGKDHRRRLQSVTPGQLMSRTETPRGTTPISEGDNYQQAAASQLQNEAESSAQKLERPQTASTGRRSVSGTKRRRSTASMPDEDISIVQNKIVSDNDNDDDLYAPPSPARAERMRRAKTSRSSSVNSSRPKIERRSSASARSKKSPVVAESSKAAQKRKSKSPKRKLKSKEPEPDPGLDPDEITDNGADYEVEAIMDHRFEDGNKFYQVKWVGYSQEDNTWEPAENLISSWELLQEYEDALDDLAGPS
jgi:hypothetical protein